MSILEKWYSDCKEYYKRVYNGNFAFAPLEKPQRIDTPVVDPMRLLKTRENYLNNS